jgi:hypothetical protein
MKLAAVYVARHRVLGLLREEASKQDWGEGER